MAWWRYFGNFTGFQRLSKNVASLPGRGGGSPAMLSWWPALGWSKWRKCPLVWFDAPSGSAVIIGAADSIIVAASGGLIQMTEIPSSMVQRPCKGGNTAMIGAGGPIIGWLVRADSKWRKCPLEWPCSRENGHDCRRRPHYRGGVAGVGWSRWRKCPLAWFDAV